MMLNTLQITLQRGLVLRQSPPKTYVTNNFLALTLSNHAREWLGHFSTQFLVLLSNRLETYNMYATKLHPQLCFLFITTLSTIS